MHIPFLISHSCHVAHVLLGDTAPEKSDLDCGLSASQKPKQFVWKALPRWVKKNQSWDHFHMHKDENIWSLSDPI